MLSYSCNTTIDIKQLSKICAEKDVDPLYECVKYVSPPVSYVRTYSGVWTIFVGILGIIGNLITLITIPYAANKHRHGLNRNFFSSTIFLLNWSFVDLIHCVLFIVPNGIQSLSDYPIWGTKGCQFNIVVGVSTMIADVGAFTFIAISRCLSINFRQKWVQFCERKLRVAILLLASWIPCFIVFSMQVLAETPHIEVGWNCVFGQCTYMNKCQMRGNNVTENHELDNRNTCRPVWLWDSMLWIMPMYVFPIVAMVITMLSYAMIWNKARQSRKNFQKSDMNSVALNHRDMKMTWTILILIVINLICWLPYIIFPVALDFPVDDMDINTMGERVFILYWILNNIFRSQYAVNFFVYVFRSEQYRNAFYDFLGLFCAKKFERNEICRHQIEMRSTRSTNRRR